MTRLGVEPLLLAAVAVASAGLGCRSGSPPSEPASRLRLIDGAGVRRLVEASPAESAVVLNFWATWCEPCKEELPTFVEVGRAYRDAGVELHFVTMDFPEARTSAVAFLEANGAPLPSYARKGKDHPFITAVHPPWSGAIPATFIYGPNKRLRHFFEGMVDEAALAGALDALVAEAQGASPE